MNRYGVLNVLILFGLVASVFAVDCNTPPEKTDLLKCCPHESLISKEIADKCSPLLTSDNTPPPPPAGAPKGPQLSPPCYMECVINSTGIMNGDVIDEAKLKAYLSKVFSSSVEFIPIVQNAFSMCAKQRPPSPPPNAGAAPVSKCKPTSAMLTHCVNMRTILNCPASVWKNDATCNNNREFVKSCKPQGGKPPM